MSQLGDNRKPSIPCSLIDSAQSTREVLFTSSDWQGPLKYEAEAAHFHKRGDPAVAHLEGRKERIHIWY